MLAIAAQIKGYDDGEVPRTSAGKRASEPLTAATVNVFRSFLSSLLAKVIEFRKVPGRQESLLPVSQLAVNLLMQVRDVCARLVENCRDQANQSIFENVAISPVDCEVLPLSVSGPSGGGRSEQPERLGRHLHSSPAGS